MKHKTIRALIFILLVQQCCISQSTSILKQIVGLFIITTTALHMVGREIGYTDSQRLKAAEFSQAIEVARGDAILKSQAIRDKDAILKICERDLEWCRYREDILLSY